MKIDPIAAPRLYQRIAGELTRLIDEGIFKVGGRLPAERELARQMQVSRSSLREALSTLELSGRVEIRIGSGVYVRAARRKRVLDSEPGQTPPFDVLRARLLVEPEAAAQAARQADGKQIKVMEVAFARLAADMRSDHVLPASDRKFHLCIARASGNAAIEMMVERLWAEWMRPLNERMSKLFVTHDHKRDSIEEHRAVLDAIRARDPAAARRAMKHHLASVGRQRMSMPHAKEGEPVRATRSRRSEMAR